MFFIHRSGFLIALWHQVKMIQPIRTDAHIFFPNPLRRKWHRFIFWRCCHGCIQVRALDHLRDSSPFVKMCTLLGPWRTTRANCIPLFVNLNEQRPTELGRGPGEAAGNDLPLDSTASFCIDPFMSNAFLWSADREAVFQVQNEKRQGESNYLTASNRSTENRELIRLNYRGTSSIVKKTKTLLKTPERLIITHVPL